MNNIVRQAAELCGVRTDQMLFFATQVISIPIAVFFRTRLGPSKASCMSRQLFGAAVGLALIQISFGWSALMHLITQVVGVYAILVFLPSHMNHKVAFVFAMGYLLCVQIKRFLDVNDREVLEVSYPMMINTQKLTSLAFSVHDGCHKKKETLGPYQQKYALRKYPSLLEMLCYVFHFAGVICGPLCFYRDYMDYLTGDNYKQNHQKKIENNNENGVSNGSSQNFHSQVLKEEPPSPSRAVAKKLSIAFVSMMIFLLLGKDNPSELNGEPWFINSHGWFYRWMYLNFSLMLARYRFYFAWMMGEAIQNAAGLGLQYENGKPNWDMLTNIKMLNIDMATSVKEYVDNWNITTVKWLRLVSYERAGRFNLAATYSLNALWHGVEPGYWVSFLTAVFLTMASRKLRRNVRPYFLDTKWKSWYDVFTCLCTHICIYYLMAGFHILDLRKTLHFYTHSMYLWMHIGIIIVLLLPLPASKTKQKST